MTVGCILKDVVGPVVPLVAALLVYGLGRATYFRQKEYELLTKRYLDGGLDAISRNVDRSLALFRHNWWQSTVLLKHFRELGKDIRPELYSASAFTAPGLESMDFGVTIGLGTSLATTCLIVPTSLLTLLSEVVTPSFRTILVQRFVSR